MPQRRQGKTMFRGSGPSHLLRALAPWRELLFASSTTAVDGLPRPEASHRYNPGFATISQTMTSMAAKAGQPRTNQIRK